MNKPTDHYSKDWNQYWLENPGHRSVGADAAEAEEVSEPAEWVSSIEDEGLRSTLGQFESQEAFFEKAGIKAPEAPEPQDWRETVSDELKDTATRFNSIDDALRSVKNLQKREGQVRVPGKEATDDEISAYHKAIGVPKAANDYNLVPEGATDQEKAGLENWSSRFHELNVPKDTAAKLVEMVNKDQEAFIEAQIKADEEFAKEQESALRDEWKGDFDKNKTIANRSLSAIAERAGVDVEALTKVETKDGRFLLDNADMLRLFATIGREMSEGTIGPSHSESDLESMQDQLDDIRKQIADASASGNSKKANSLYQKEQELISRMKGNKGIVGAEGRRV